LRRRDAENPNVITFPDISTFAPEFPDREELEKSVKIHIFGNASDIDPFFTTDER
jgi:hypothetical protein